MKVLSISVTERGRLLAAGLPFEHAHGDAGATVRTRWGEVDAFVRADSSCDVREVHPELVFLRLNDNKPLPSKKSEEGDSLRRALLKRQGIRDVDVWISRTRMGTGANRDDVLDACAVAIAVRDPAGSVPEGGPRFDACRLPMQIWF